MPLWCRYSAIFRPHDPLYLRRLQPYRRDTFGECQHPLGTGGHHWKRVLGRSLGLERGRAEGASSICTPGWNT